jgi:dTDP-4-dehydrorhamnose reductase
MNALQDHRVLITGAGGMLGSAIYPYFSSRFGAVQATDKDLGDPWISRLDVRDTPALQQTFADFRPTIVLHLAACTDLEFCEANPDVARDTNATATGTVADACEQSGATLVYISTAGVFDGTKQGPYTEDDAPRPIMVYGQTKRDGEILAAARCRRHFIVRAGWMIGGGAMKDHKFVQAILGQILAGAKVIHAVNDRFGTPTYAHDFALNLLELLASERHGTYHMVCEGSGSRHDVARHILDICGRDDIELKAVDSSFFGHNYYAPRPVSEMMLNTRLAALGLNHMRPWQDALRDYISREFAPAMAGAETGGERRCRPDRRKQHMAWKGAERRKSAGRRTTEAALQPAQTPAT